MYYSIQLFIIILINKNLMQNCVNSQEKIVFSQIRGQVKQESVSQETELSFVDFGQINLPKGLRISKNQYGYCLLATKSFKKGQIIYKGKVPTIPLSVKTYRYTIEGKEYILTNQNSVKLANSGYRHAYTFDGFMNHSCDPSSVSLNLNEGEDEFDQYILRDIEEGEEVSCNYAQYDYECDGHFFECGCGSPKCYKVVRGFKGLNLAQQIQLLPIVYPMVRQAWLEDNPEIVLIDDLRTPSGLQVCESKGYRKLVARKEFKKGEVICTSEPVEIKDNSTLIVKVGEKYQLVNMMPHTIGKEESRSFLYFGSFINHSCEPNSSIISQREKIILESTRHIQVGQQITFDYTTSNVMSDSEEFQCECKSENCRGVILRSKKEKLVGAQTS